MLLTIILHNVKKTGLAHQAVTGQTTKTFFFLTFIVEKKVTYNNLNVTEEKYICVAFHLLHL